MLPANTSASRGSLFKVQAGAGPCSVPVGTSERDDVTREALQRHVRPQLHVLIVECQPKILPDAVGHGAAGGPCTVLTERRHVVGVNVSEAGAGGPLPGQRIGRLQ